jgi:osmotically-inducible protein OsmY
MLGGRILMVNRGEAYEGSNVMSLRRSIVMVLSVAAAAPLVSGCVPIIAAGAVAGVSAARQERSVGNAIDDVRIKTELDTRLARSAGLFFSVSTTVVEGRVLIAGRVKEPETRIEATRIAWSVEGVRKVDNDLEVSDYSGWLDGPSDLIMRTQVAAALFRDEKIKDVNYTTDVVHGVVYLMGVGQDQAEIDRAVADAETINGVKRVENYVVLKDDPIRYGFSGPTASR